MISVIIPVHNKLPHLDRSIQSVLHQTFGEFELLLIDDASTDGSSERLQQYDDSRIRVFRRDTPGRGGYAARNLGIQKAKHEWISFLDADDEWSPEYLEKVVSVIGKVQDAEIISVGWEKVHEYAPFLHYEDLTYAPFTLHDYLLNHELICTDAISIKKKLLLDVGGFPAENPKCKRGGDVDTWIRCLSISKLNINIPQLLAYYYQDTVNQVTDINKNPTYHFCAYDSIKKIYDTTADKGKRKVIRNYINDKIIHILKRPNGFRISLISKMYLTPLGVKNVVKIFLVKMKLMK